MLNDTNINVIRLLIISDAQSERTLLFNLLSENYLFSFKILEASNLPDGIKLLEEKLVDVVILDLAISRGHFAETFCCIREHHINIAVIVIVPPLEEPQGLEAIRKGAQDYLLKGFIDGFILVRTIQHALERQRLLNELELLRLQQRQNLEMTQLENYVDDNIQNGQIFSLAANYNSLVRHYVFATREGQPRPYVMMKSLAQRLVAMKVKARDVVRLHLKVLKETGIWTTTTEERAFSVDARLVLVELLGTLADIYRDLAQI